MPRFSTLLIANRGEIACRIIRTAKEHGYRTVAVYSDADHDAPHVRAADRAVHIGPAHARASYLSIEAIIRAAQASGAEAIHPGYGFLSENVHFARAIMDAGLIFVGPPLDALELMGSKRKSKERMIAAGVPCVPGFLAAGADNQTLMEAARAVGFPLMIKASMGGGGKGLRRVDAEAQLEGRLALARTESEAAFGDAELILERVVDHARHVEIQVFGDEHGHLIHLGERDCSMQRRHQKVIEEAPSPAVDEALRARMGEAAVQAARSIGYVGAGTVEFLLGPDGQFYFMEMNTRLQVEHPVTEMITGLDLVGWQLDVAQGERLPLPQSEVSLIGHAIEVRLYAEDPQAGFLPSTGTIHHLRWPSHEGVRIDHGLEAGFEVLSHYDPMLAKLIAHGRSREEARRRLLRALASTEIAGVSTNRDFLLAALAHPTFIAGEVTTGFLESSELGQGARPPVDGLWWAVAAALWTRPEHGHWSSAAPHAHSIELERGAERRTLRVEPSSAEYLVKDREDTFHFFLTVEGANVALERDGVRDSLRHVWCGDALDLFTPDLHLCFHQPAFGESRGAGAQAREVSAPMSGRIIEVRATPGLAVTKGEVLLVMEAMKMQLEITAKADLVVETVFVSAGDQVDSKQVLVGFAEGPGSTT